MNIIEPIILGLVLSADSFSAAIAMGLRPHRFSDALKFAVVSGGAALTATFLGFVAGEKIISQFSTMNRWLAFFLLSAVALHLFYEGIKEWKNRDKPVELVQFHGFIKLLIVAIATSIDALAVGVSLAVTSKPLWIYLVTISGWAFILTLLGMGIARNIPKRFSAVFNFIAAVILFILAVEMS